MQPALTPELALDYLRALGRHAVVLVCGRLALGALHRYDVRRVLSDLDGPDAEGREAA